MDELELARKQHRKYCLALWPQEYVDALLPVKESPSSPGQWLIETLDEISALTKKEFCGRMSCITPGLGKLRKHGGSMHRRLFLKLLAAVAFLGVGTKESLGTKENPTSSDYKLPGGRDRWFACFRKKEEPKPPGSLCPACWEEDVNVSNGRCVCNICGAEAEMKMTMTWEPWPGGSKDLS